MKTSIISRSRSGQALIEVFFIVILFIFVGVMAYETGVLYYNVNTVSNSLKQAIWRAAVGAPDEEIMAAISDADAFLMKSALFEHRVEDFGIEVWIKPQNSAIEQNIAPTPCDNLLSPAAAIKAGDPWPRRAAYVWRAHNLNIRVGLTYRAGYVAPYFQAAPTFLINLPLTASEPITARNDEDRDGLVDLYEQELFERWRQLSPATYAAPTAFTTSASNQWRAYVHTDSRAHFTDDMDTNIDADSILDAAEGPGIRPYDFDNDDITDMLDPKQNFLRHPRLGGNPMPICI